MATTDWPKEPLTPAMIDMLDQVLKAWCEETGTPPRSDIANMKARALVDWVEFGIVDDRELAMLIREQISVRPDFCQE